MWTRSVDEPGDEPDPEFFLRIGPPQNEIPVVLPLTEVLARTPDAAVALTRMAVFSTGALFDLVVRVRPGVFPRADVGDLLWRRGGGPAQMLIGLELADGTRLDNNRRQGPTDAVVFMQQGGSGSEDSVDQGWWLHPLPPPGPLRFVVRCPDLGIEETSTEFDGAAVRRAAEGVTELWPWTPPRPAADERGLPPEVPGDSWFAG
jgi:hypothetical protein